MRKISILLLLALLLMPVYAPATDGTANPDAVSGPSKAYYGDTSLGQEALQSAIRAGGGICTVATVNADGSPNLAVFAPGSAGEDHLYFSFAPNDTGKNLLRDKQAMLCYYLPATGEEGDQPGGARVRAVLEEDAETLDALYELVPSATDGYVFLRIEEVLPLG